METPPASAIMLRLRELAQLFNSMDPSPFVDRDLDADAEEFITSWARELPANRELELVIQLATPATAERLGGVEDAVRSRLAGCRNRFCRAVGGVIVHNDDLEYRTLLFGDAGQKLQDELFSPKGWYNYTNQEETSLK